MNNEISNEDLLSNVRARLGVDKGGLKYPTYVAPPSFKPGTNDLDDKSALKRRARFIASGEMLFKTDLSTLDDTGASALYEVVTEGMFGLKDTDGQMAFGKRAKKNPRENLEMLRRFVKGDYTLIEDPEYTKWREMDEEGKFRYALENESKATKVKSHLKGERGASPLEVMFFGMAANPPSTVPGMARTFRPQEVNEAMDKQYADSARRLHYDALNDEEKAAYRADVIGDYEKKLSRRQTLATYLQFASNLSDKAAYLLAESFQKGAPDFNVEMLDPEERDRVYSAFSLMRGDKKRGHLLGFIEQDFEDGTAFGNRFQLGLYGLQQSLVGLVTDMGDMMRDGAMWAYAIAKMEDAERKAFFEGWDANVRAERAMEQALPEAEGWFGAGFQGLMENVHWFIPYGVIGKGGKIAAGATKTVNKAKLTGETLKGMRTASEIKAAAAKTRWLDEFQGAVNAGRKIDDLSSVIAWKNQVAAIEKYTKALQNVAKVEKTAKMARIGGRSLWTVGEASALSAFSSEYLAAADAAGISREESVITAFAIGLINAQVERLYVAGLESSLTPAQVKALTFKALYNAVKSDGAAGFRKWFANRVQRGVVEGAKVTVTEGMIEEPLQQLATEHGIAFDKICQELRAEGKADVADQFVAFWQSFAKQLPKDYGIFIDTVCDTMPTSLAFGVRTVGNAKFKQHLHNAWTRHKNRRAGSTHTMLGATSPEELRTAIDYDAGLVDLIQQGINTQLAVEKHWKGDKSDEEKNPHRFVEALTAARRAYRNPQTRDVVQEVAEAAGVDVKTAEVITQYLQTEAESIAFSPQARAFSSLRMSLADIDETTIKTVLPGYIEGSFAADEENGIYSGRVKLGDGTERTIAYRIGDLSEMLREQVEENSKIDSSYGVSFDERQEELGTGITWASLSDAQRYQYALTLSNGISTGRGVFELTDAKGEKVRVNADDVIYLANGRLGDIGYGTAASMGTARHETFHSLWRFARATLDEEDVQSLAKALGVDVTANGWENKLDERMAHQLEMYASGHYVSHAVSSRFDKMLDGWAGKVIKFFGSLGPADEVRDPKTGKSFALKDFYDMVLRGELGSGKLGVEIRNIPAAPAVQPGATDVKAGTIPVEVTDEERAAQDAEMREEAAERGEDKGEGEERKGVSGQESGVSANPSKTNSAENPADASVPNQRYYIIGLPNSDIKLVGRLEVRDAHTGIITSTDADYHDRGNQNRDDRSEESRALVEKIGANPDPLQIGTVQPIANNGIVWLLNNSNVIIGNHRVNGVRLGYEKGTAGELEKFVREDAAKRGIEIGEGVNAPLTVFILERIESPDGKADVHEVVRLVNESQNRGFNIREQAGNDAKILADNNLLPRMAFRPDGRIDETKSADAIGKFRQESGAQGMVGEDGMLTEEGQTRLQNAAVAALLGGTGNNALLGRIMDNAGRLDMASQLRALMKVTPELMALAKTKPQFDIRDALAEALTLYTEWREKDEEKRSEKGKSRHDWRELDKEGKRKRGLSWEAFMSQGDMFRTPSAEAKILGDLFARTEQLRSFDREDVESAAGKKRVVDLITDYLTDYIENARNVNTETVDMFGSAPASRDEVLAAQRAKGESGARFSMSVNPKLGEDIREAVNTDRNTKTVVSGHKEVVFASHAPEVLIASGIPDGRIYTHAFILRKMKDDHDLDEVAIENLVVSAQSPAAILHDVDKKKGTEAFIILTEQTAKDLNGRVAPVMIYLRPDSNGNYIASAYARTEKGEKHYIGLLNSGSLLAINKSKVAGLNLTGEAKSSFESVRTDDNVVDLERFTPEIISNSLPENNGPSAELLEAMVRKAADEKKNTEKNSDEKRMYSIASDMTGGIFPEISRMSDDELVTAAVAVRMALGETGKFSDRAVKVNTVNKIIRRLHPEYKSTDVGRESLRVISDARKFAKKIREDLDRGVSDSLILEHLPQTAREQFGREMVEEARRGQRLGRFGQKVTDKLEDRQARIVEDAVRVQTGMDVSLMENLYGINLSETLMHLAENPLTEKPPQSAGAGEGETAEAVEESAGEEAEPIDVSAAVKAAVDEIVGAAKTATDANERNRADRRAAAGRDAERAAELDGEDATGGGAGDDFGGKDIVAVATKKAKVDLENPRHLAEFVAELTRRYWIKEHELGQNAEVWRDLVAVQFLRKTAQGIYAKLCKDLTYSRSRETAMQRIAKFDHAATVQGLLTQMTFVGALINSQRIRDTQKALCEKLDFFLRQKFGAQGRFKPDKEEGKRNVSAEAELCARDMRHAMWLTPDAAADEARELQEKLDLLAVEFTDAGRDHNQSREFNETIRMLNVLREFGALRYKSVGEIEAAAKRWEDLERGESDEILRAMSDRDIRTKKAAELLAKAFADPKRVTVREGTSTADRINKALTGHFGFISIIKDCMRHASDADREAVKDIVGWLELEIQKAGDGTATEKRHHNDAFHAAVESIYAKSFNKVMKEMMVRDDRFLKFMGEVGGKRDIPTKGRAMQLLVSLLQEGRKVEIEDEENPGKTKFIYEGGYHDNIVKHKREGQAAELMKLMSPADMNMIKWLGMWYEQNRQDLSRVCHSLFGIGVYAELPNYFPVKMRLDKQGLEKGAAVGWTIFPKALTPRVKNERDFDTSADIFQMWSSRMEEGAQWKHHAQLGLEMRGIFGRAELQGAVISNHGEATNALMQGFITDVLAGKGAVDRSTGDVQYISDKIRGWTALCALGGNVGVMLKQLTSIPAFGFEIGLIKTASHVITAFTPEGISAMVKIWNSEQRKTRWDVGYSEAVANALREDRPSKPINDIGGILQRAGNGSKEAIGLLKRMLQASMITNKIGDVVPALIVGQGIYRDCIAQGMSETDAMAKTWMIVERTQQSSRMENLASIQRRNVIGRMMYQFLSTQRQYLDYELRAIREVIAQPTSVKRWKKLGTTTILNHFILTTLYWGVGQLYKAMLGQEPPEDQLTDAVISCLMGPNGSLFVVGFCCNETLQRAMKGNYYGSGTTMLPMESWIKTQIGDGIGLTHAIFDREGDTWDNILDATSEWLSDFNSTFRDLRKIYRYRIKDENQKK